MVNKIHYGNVYPERSRRTKNVTADKKMRIYITYSFGDNKEKIEKFSSIVKSSGFKDFIFIRDVENYQKIFDNPKDLMKRSADEIKKSDALLIDMTDKPTGRAIEAGMAYSLGKKIIVIMKKGTKIKDTTKGIADTIIEYDAIEDICSGLRDTLRKTEIS